MAKNKHDVTQDKTCTDFSHIPGSDFYELIWENGQITMQDQSSRTKRTQNSYNLPSYTSLPSHSPRIKDKDLGNDNTCSSSGKFLSSIDNRCGLDEFPEPVPSGEMRLDPGDDIVPWFSYPIIINDFMHELSGVTENHEPTNPNNFDEKGSCNQVYREGHPSTVHGDTELEQRYQSKGLDSSSSPAVFEITRPKTNSSQQQGLVPGRFEVESPCSRSRPLEKVEIGASNAANQTVSKNSTRFQTQHPGPSSGANSVFINFSHFSRQAPNYRTNAVTGSGASSGYLGVNKVGCKEKASSANCSNNAKIGGAKNVDLRRESSSQCQNMTEQSNVCLRDVKGKQIEEQHSLKHSEATIPQGASEKDKKSDRSSDFSTARRLINDDKSTEPVVVASSVCSGSGVERASENPTCNLKRKSQSTEESDDHSEDIEEVSVGVKKAPPARSSGSKRGRVAEVHNLSERRRRDRINEKMRALQELIPNCNKADKASMLDEAIEYLKTLQLQVQMMSMGAGFYMPHMLLPTQMQQMHMARMAQFSALGYRMGMVDISGGSSTYPMMQFPSLHGAHFPCPVMPGPAASVVGLPSQGLHMPMACAPLVSFPSGSIVQPANGVTATAPAAHLGNTDSDITSNMKVSVQKNGASCSHNNTAIQCQVENEGLQQSVLIQNNCQVSDNNGNPMLPSSN